MTKIGSQEGKTSYGPKELASFLKQLNDEDTVRILSLEPCKRKEKNWVFKMPE
jgi:hypothetical protein